MKHSTQLRRMDETFFFRCCYCQMFIFWRCFFNSSSSSVFGSLSLLRFDHFRPHLRGFFELVSDEKKNETRERCVESLTKRKTFLIIHPPPMEIPAKNTMGLSIKKVTFTSVERKNRHLSYNFTLFHFFFLTHKDHTKTFTMSQKSKFMQYIYFFCTAKFRK